MSPLESSRRGGSKKYHLVYAAVLDVPENSRQSRKKKKQYLTGAPGSGNSTLLVQLAASLSGGDVVVAAHFCEPAGSLSAAIKSVILELSRHSRDFCLDVLAVARQILADIHVDIFRYSVDIFRYFYLYIYF